MVHSGQYTVAIEEMQCNATSSQWFCICRSNPSPMVCCCSTTFACTRSPASHLRRRCALEALMLPRRLIGRLADTLLPLAANDVSLFQEANLQSNGRWTQPSPFPDLFSFPPRLVCYGPSPSSGPVAIPRPSSNVPPCLVQSEKRPRSNFTIPTLYCGMWQRRNEATRKGKSKRRRVSNYCPIQSIVSFALCHSR